MTFKCYFDSIGKWYDSSNDDSGTGLILHKNSISLQPDPHNIIFQHAIAFVNQTGRHLFLTGKAGTGKTTFLKYIRDHSFKKMAIVAPTGVAAINAGGVTIHSLFQLPFGAFIPDTRRDVQYGGEVNTPATLLAGLRLNNARRTLLRELDLLVIDEISMVRADVLDAVDTVLRSVRRQPLLPFGGVQMLYIGDLFQLPPVAKNQEWDLLRTYYRSPFFFDAVVLQQVPPVYLELKTIYRQKDSAFIHVLNNIRNNSCTTNDLELLHQYYKPGFRPAENDHYITLTSHNYKADTINREELEKLPASKHVYEAEVRKDFYESSYPAEKTLELREGAQVMFIKNDKGEQRRYYNGKIGTIKELYKDKVVVAFPGQEQELEVEKETWKNIRYQYNTNDDKVEEEELGSFTQYPLRLAWAITIHKSQGLTFERAIIDAGDSFAPGQVYVSLSRLVSLNGLVLLSKIPASAISTDPRVVAFVQSERNEDELKQLLKDEQSRYVRQVAAKNYSWAKVLEAMNQYHNDYVTRQIPEKHKAYTWSVALLAEVEALHEVATKFARQLDQLFSKDDEEGVTQLYNRMQSASSYFLQKLEEVIASVKEHFNEYRLKLKTKKYLADLKELQAVFERKKVELEQALKLAEAMRSAAGIDDLLKIVEEQQRPGAPLTDNTKVLKAPKGETRKLSFEMFKGGKTIQEIATERNLAESTVHGHLSTYILTGELEVSELVEADKMNRILDALKKNSSIPHSELRLQLGDDISYGDIKAVVNHLARLEVTEGTAISE